MATSPKDRQPDFLDGLAANFEITFLWTLGRYALGGLVSGLAVAGGLALVAQCVAQTKEDEILRAIFLGAYLYAAVLIATCIIIAAKATLTRMLDSRRVDLALAAFAGLTVGLSFHLTVAKYTVSVIDTFSGAQLIAVFTLPTALLTLFVATAAIRWRRKKPDSTPATFFSDAELRSLDDDLLDVRADAERFAARVLNGGSQDSMVFGLDAPWGAGKSSFVNFCEEWWKARPERDVVIYRFNPLQYEDRKGLLSKFVDGLISTLQEHVFIPELQSTVSKYAQLFKGERKVSLFGFDLTLGAPQVSVESAHETLSKALSTLPKRLIVIIDDLDRMDFASLKDILFVAKKCFSFPNISFVLCYDTQNIASLDGVQLDSEKISEFLEKFVNVKQGLFPTAETLSRYLTRSRDLAGSHNPLSDPKLLDQAVGGLLKIYKSDEYVKYLPLVGDVRKIKRLLNILVLLDLTQTNFELSDFDPVDLLHLLLVYINFPGLFRTIYNAETGGRNHFVSLTRRYNGSGGSNFENSDGFPEFIEMFAKRKTELLLLTRLFDVSRFDNASTSNVSEVQLRTLACFNDEVDERPGNLTRYLQLIVSVSKPPSGDSFRTLLKYKDEIVAGRSISSLYTDISFHPMYGEARYEQLWRVVTNSLEQFDAKGCAALIDEALKALPRHAQMEVKAAGLGFRQTLVYFLLKLLDIGGWSDADGHHRDNTDGNVQGIARWIFGEGTHRDGILDTLMAPERGVLGLHDALIFRLYCCADRAGSLFNLTRAVGDHSDKQTPKAGLLSEIVKPQMREMSQFIFRKFKEQYIDQRKNIFTLHQALTPEDMCGGFYPALQAAVNRGELTRVAIEDAAIRNASRCMSFSIYQLANNLVSSGIGCGYYDEAGTADSGEIRRVLNEYFFDVCFAPDSESGGIMTFLDFALCQLSNDFGQRSLTYTPNIQELLKVFEVTRLREYWREVRDRVKSKYFGMDHEVKTMAYTVNYLNDLGPMVKVLDGFADS